MPIPVTLDLGVLGAGWTVYYNVFSPDDTEVWNGSSFVADSDANQNAGAIAMTEDGGNPGLYESTFPAGITTPGVYPIRARRQIGGSPNVAVDTLLTYEIANNSIALFAGGATGDLAPHQCYWSDLSETAPRSQIRVAWEGAGRPFLFSRLEGPAATTGLYRLDISTMTNLATVILSVNGVLDPDTGDILVNPTIAQRALLDRNATYLGRLWRYDTDDNTDVLGVVVLGTL